MRRMEFVAVIVAHLAVTGPAVCGDALRGEPRSSGQPATAVVDWSNEARRAIVPAGPNGVFGAENYGNKFAGEAAVYMGIVHAAIYGAVVTVEGMQAPLLAAVLTESRGASADAAVATAAHHVLVGLQPALGLTPGQQAGLDQRYADYLAAIPQTASKSAGVAVGIRVAKAVLAWRSNDGREANPTLGDLNPPPPAAGVWDEGSSGAVGLRMPGIRPLALRRASQFRPHGPSALAGREYARDFRQVADLGRTDSTVRKPAETALALFWTDHDLRQWNDGLLGLAASRHLDLAGTARLLAMAHVAGGDAMIACFDAKYTYWFWRPYQAIPAADQDGNPLTTADTTWQPLRPTPNFPEYPSAHACHSAAMATAIGGFFGSDRIAFTLDSRVTNTVRHYRRLEEVVEEVNQARVLAGFHYFNSDREGARLGRRVAGYVVRRFQSLR